MYSYSYIYLYRLHQSMHDGIRLQQAVVPNPTKSQCNSIDDPINRSLRQRPGGALGGRHVTRVIGA